MIVEAKKTCTKCKIERPVSDFSRQSCSLDGLQQWCRKCQRYYREIHPRRMGRVLNPTIKRQDIFDDWHREDWRAFRKNAVVRTSLNGLVRLHPCALCGSPDTYAHHLDYCLDIVVYLCPECHGHEHSSTCEHQFAEPFPAKITFCEPDFFDSNEFVSCEEDIIRRALVQNIRSGHRRIRGVKF